MSRWAGVLGVREDEKHLVVRMAAVFAVIQSTHALGANSADALFFLRYGVENLPFMILISGIAVMAALLFHSAGLGRWGARRWLPLMTAACAAIALVEWVLSFAESNGVYPFIWVTTQVLIMVSFTVMWNAAAASSTTRQAKRLYPVYASAGVAGAVIGNLATGPLASVLGTQSLLGLQGLGLAAGAFLLSSITGFFLDEDRGERHSTVQELAGAFKTIRVTRLLRLTAVAVFILSGLFFLVVFPFNEAVASSFDTEADVARFLGVFASVSTALTFLVSLLLTNRLFARLGIVVSLVIVPAVYLIGFGVWLTSFTLASAAIVRGSQWVAVNAIEGTATKALFNFLPGRRRGPVMSFMAAVPAQLGIIAGGAILMAATSISQRALFLIGLLLAVAGLVTILSMRSAYTDAIVSAVRNGLVGVFGVPSEGVVSPFGRESIDVLSRYLEGSTPEERLTGVIALSAAGDTAHNDLIEPLLGDVDPHVRMAAFDSMCASDPSRLDTLIATGLDDESPRVRRHVLKSATASPAVGVMALADPDLAVRATAARVVGGANGQKAIDDLLASGQPEAILAVLEEVGWADDLEVDPHPYLEHSDPNIRAAAVQLVSIDATDDDVRKRLDDTSVRVRRIAAETLAKTEDGRTILLETLRTGTVSATEAALRSLAPVDRFTDDFLAWAQREATRARNLAELRSAALSGESSASIEFLVEVIERRCRTLSDWVILGMTTADTEKTMAIVERGIASGDAETRAQAIEAVEVIGTRSVTKPLIDLLEAQVGESELTQQEALTELADDFDPWISSLARRSLEGPPSVEHVMPESAAMKPDGTHRSMSRLDRVIALQRVPMFSGLDPEDLELIARVVKEVHFLAGEQVYRAGDVGKEMMVIIDGEAVVTSEHDGTTHEVARYGAGQHVGELALLQGSVRSADVYASDAGLSALVIADLDLTSVLQERPTVAIAMLGTLASRLAEQT